jgi:hypothetical protein
MANRERVAEIPERDLDVHPVLPEPSRVPHQGADLMPVREQRGQELSTDHAGCSREEDHAATVARRTYGAGFAIRSWPLAAAPHNRSGLRPSLIAVRPGGH